MRKAKQRQRQLAEDHALAQRMQEESGGSGTAAARAEPTRRLQSSGPSAWGRNSSSGGPSLAAIQAAEAQAKAEGGAAPTMAERVAGQQAGSASASSGSANQASAEASMNLKVRSSCLGRLEY